MGLSPLAGVPMGTRAGDIDTCVAQFIMNKYNMSADDCLTMLNKKSGVLALSGVSSDFRDLCAGAEAGNEDAELAIHAYCYSIKKYIGAYAAVMGGLDAIVFGGGIGLNSPLVRALSLEGLEFLGVRLDGFKNRMAIAGMDISMEDAPVRVFTVHTDEEIIVARKAAALLSER